MDINEIIYNALLEAKKGNWEKAHNVAQSREGHTDYDRLHALVHRIEGDEWNAKYWYNRCKIEMPKVSIKEEIEMLLDQYR